MNTKFFALPYEVEGKTYFTYLNLEHIVSISGVMAHTDTIEPHIITITMSNGLSHEVKVEPLKTIDDYLKEISDMPL